MSWGNPWALLGLGAVAVPILIHLLGQQRARVQKFPSLRFLAASRLTPTRRVRLTDLVLLAVRVGIVAAAALALAQPLFRAPARDTEAPGNLRRILTRAIIVDTSASMRRATPSGGRARDVARQQATTLAAEATQGLVIETVSPRNVVVGAVEWLKARPGVRELVIVSDFQRGSLDATDLDSVPSSIGLKLVPVSVVARGADGVPFGNRVGLVTSGPTGTSVTWSAARPIRTAVPLALAGSDELSLVDAAREAANSVGGPPADSSRPTAFIYMKYPQRGVLLQRATALDVPWMGDAVARLHADTELATAAAGATGLSDTSAYDARFTTVIRDSAQRPVVLASSGDVGGTHGLQLWVLANPGSLVSAALFAELASALSPVAAASEIDPQIIPSAVLSSWERPASASPAAGPTDGDSDGRWLWLVVLVLLGAETALRRRARDTAGPGSFASLRMTDSERAA